MKKSLVFNYLMILIVLAGCFPITSAFAEDKAITLKFAHFVPATTLEGKTMQDWANEVEKRTNGRVKVTIYPGATLMPPQQTYDGITKEVADIGYGIFAYHRGRFPLTEVMDLPLGYKDPSVPTKLINAYYQQFKPKELDDVKVLFLEAHGPGILSTKTPIQKLEDVKGMKIRAHGVSARIVSALGAAPVGLPITDTYDALSKGVVNGLMLDWGGLYNWKMGDVVKNHIDCRGIAYTTSFYTVMNKDKWNKLPSDIQAIIDQLDTEWIARVQQKWADWEAMGKKNLTEKGNTISVLSDEENKRWATNMQQVIDEWVKSTAEKGVPAEEALKFCREFLAANDK